MYMMASSILNTPPIAHRYQSQPDGTGSILGRGGCGSGAFAAQEVTRYTGAFVELFRLKDGWRHNNRHGMIEVQRADLPAKDNIQSLFRQRFYGLNLV
jgi:hypothetical protein